MCFMGKTFFWMIISVSCFLCCTRPSLTQLSDMSENEDVLLEFFVSLPQLKQVTSDKEELVTSIVDMASKFLFCCSTAGVDEV